MLYTILHLVERLFGKDGILLGTYRIGHLHRVAHLNLLVPACLAHSLLALEGVEARHIEGDGGERYRDGLIA